jgi:pimeloyl-ACP methyl ester carboxylesterase
VLAAARRPDLFAGIVALDPVLVPTRIWFWARVFSFFKPDAVPIVKRALARPHWFESSDAAFEFYRGKRVFTEVSDTVLRDYVSAGHIAQPDGSVTLRHSGAWEACIYRSVPRMTGSLKAVACPLLIVAGESSDVLNAERVSWVKAINPAVEIQSLMGGHLLPLEAPEACARAAAEFIRRH